MMQNETKTIGFRSLVNGIEFDVPENEITVDLLTKPRSQPFVAPMETVQAKEGSRTEAGVPRKKSAKVEVE